MFKDREDAGKKLALKLKKILHAVQDENFVAVALLRGGIVLGKIIADYFKIPLIPLAVKKIGAPTNSELAIGAVTFDKTHYFDEELVRHFNINNQDLNNLLEEKYQEAKNLQDKFPTTTPRLRSGLRGARVIIVDDGIATGATAICASIYAKNQKAKEIILATPLIAKDTLKNIKVCFDKVISLKITPDLTSVSQFYKNFPQVSDEEVIEILNSKE